MSAKKPKESYFNVYRAFKRLMDNGKPVDCKEITYRKAFQLPIDDIEDRLENVVRCLLKKYDPLEISIAKYMYMHNKQIRTNVGWNTCALCISKGWRYEDINSRKCNGCILLFYGAKEGCDGTPYDKFVLYKLDEQEFFDVMAEELDYLIGVWRQREAKRREISERSKN